MNNNHPDKVLIFDIMGRNAHFRKFYTNSSSLSYLVPPRTVIAGLIAGLLGLPSERFTNEGNKTYYDKFNSENCFIAVSLKTPIRKMMQTVNYCFTKTQNKEISFSKHSQIPLEILTAQNEKELRYRIYFFHKENSCINGYSRKIELLKKNRFVYPPYLGLSEFLASINFIDEGIISSVDQPEKLHSICKLDYIKDFNVENEVKYLTERMPTGFTNKRNPLSPADYLIEVNRKPIYAIYKEDALLYQVEYEENGETVSENISPM
jgi:CRISPR-associated protein Cas5h